MVLSQANFLVYNGDRVSRALGRQLLIVKAYAGNAASIFSTKHGHQILLCFSQLKTIVTSERIRLQETNLFPPSTLFPLLLLIFQWGKEEGKVSKEKFCGVIGFLVG